MIALNVSDTKTTITAAQRALDEGDSVTAQRMLVLALTAIMEHMEQCCVKVLYERRAASSPSLTGRP